MRYANATVLAGGLGTRLRSVVADRPKPLAPVAGRPFLAYLLDHLAAQGIQTVTLATGYRGDLVEEAFGAAYAGMDVRYSREPEPRGTGGAVALALANHPPTGPTWILNGDTFFDCDLAAVADLHDAHTPAATLALARIDDAGRYGLVDLSADGPEIAAFRENEAGTAGLINAGVYLLDPVALARADLPETFSLERDFFAAGLRSRRLVGAAQDGYFIDIGVPSDYAAAQEHFAR